MTFDPFDPAPVHPPALRKPVSDTRHAPGNISARIRREGTPRGHQGWARLMSERPRVAA